MDLKDVHTPIAILIGGFVISIVLLSLEFNFRWFFVEYNFLQVLIALFIKNEGGTKKG